MVMISTKSQKIYVEQEASKLTTSISMQPSEPSIPKKQDNQPFLAPDRAWLILISIALLSAVGCVAWVYRRKIYRQPFQTQPEHKIHCQRCRYFCQNPYLQCTIHPSTVMTEASIDCMDYWPKIHSQSSERTHK
jgi:hypothetical protein